MELNLKNPVAFLDLETTGINTVSDRIVEISILKITPKQTEETKTWLVNPEMKIPAQAAAIHGITDDKVKDAPTFKELAKTIAKFIEGCDLGGFNSNRFDIPLLAEEFLRAEVDVDMKKRKFIDVQTIFHKMEQRTLTAAYQLYCNKSLENAHSAEADTRATYEVLLAQLEKYDNLKNDVEWLAGFSSFNKNVDFAGRITMNDKNEEVFNFGKHKGKSVAEVFRRDPSYYSWMINNEFPLYTKKILTEIKLREFNK